MWKVLGRWYVPEVSPVGDEQRWYNIGIFLALALLTTGSVHPVSPALIYALLVQTFYKPELDDTQTMMQLSLGFIAEVDESQAKIVLPWMIIPPGQDLSNLPEGHRTNLMYALGGLGLDVSLLLTEPSKRKSEGNATGHQGFLSYRVRSRTLECRAHHMRTPWNPNVL
jgi:hypothetical protein